MISGMMSGRYQWLQWLVDGYTKTGGIPLIGYTDGQVVPFNAGDDIGIYYCIPKLAYIFSLSLDQTIYLFFYGLVIGAGILAGIGFLLLYRPPLVRVVAGIGLLELVRHALVADVYCAYAVAPLALIPLWLYMQSKHTLSWAYLLWTFVSGIILGFVHYIRAYSGLPAAVFVCCIIITARLKWVDKIIAAMIVLVGYCVPYLFFSHIYAQYGAYASTVFPTTQINLKQHVLWHTIYVGFGFLNNNLGIVWDDTCAAQTVHALAPHVAYTSQAYEDVLKCQVGDLIRYHYFFALQTLFAKLGVLCMYLVRYAHIGLIAAWYYRKPWHLDAVFVFTLCTSCIFPLVAIPQYMYALSFITCASLYGIVSINYALSVLFYRRP